MLWENRSDYFLGNFQNGAISIKYEVVEWRNLLKITEIIVTITCKWIKFIIEYKIYDSLSRD